MTQTMFNININTSAINLTSFHYKLSSVVMIYLDDRWRTNSWEDGQVSFRYENEADWYPPVDIQLDHAHLT